MKSVHITRGCHDITNLLWILNRTTAGLMHGQTSIYARHLANVMCCELCRDKRLIQTAVEFRGDGRTKMGYYSRS